MFLSLLLSLCFDCLRLADNRSRWLVSEETWRDSAVMFDLQSDLDPDGV